MTLILTMVGMMYALVGCASAHYLAYVCRSNLESKVYDGKVKECIEHFASEHTLIKRMRDRVQFGLSLIAAGQIFLIMGGDTVLISGDGVLHVSELDLITSFIVLFVLAQEQVHDRTIGIMLGILAEGDREDRE